MITITGQPPSKSNSYKVTTLNGHASLGKTKALKEYEESFFMQCPLRNAKISGRFRLEVDVYFTSDRPDLDNSLKVILDCLQSSKAIMNDRQCSEITARKFIDKTNPRIEFELQTDFDKEEECFEDPYILVDKDGVTLAPDSKGGHFYFMEWERLAPGNMDIVLEHMRAKIWFSPEHESRLTEAVKRHFK